MSIQPSFAQNTYRYYVEPLPEWAKHAENAVQGGISYWENKDPNLRLTQVFSYGDADFVIRWVKEIEGGRYAGTAYEGGLVEITVADYFCHEVWVPYHPDFINNIVAHEVGHVVGYNHSPYVDDIMYETVPGTRYLIQEDQFETEPGYLYFIGLCTVKEVTSYDFHVTINDPNGLDVYFVPSIREFDNYWISPHFNYYQESECYATDVTDYSGTCNGVSWNGGLVIRISDELSQESAIVTVSLQEKDFTENLKEQPTSLANTGFIPESQSAPTVSVEVQTDRSTYEDKDVVLISGKLTDPSLEGVSIVITNPAGQMVSKVRLDTTQDGEFQTSSDIATSFQAGSYTISVYDDYGQFLGDTTFTVQEVVSTVEKTSEEDEERMPIAEEISREKITTLNTYYNDEYHFSIDYPEDWQYYDTAQDFGTYYDTFEQVTSPIELYNNVDEAWESGFWVNYFENEIEPTKERGQQYLDVLIDSLRFECKVASFEDDGYRCSNHAIIDTEILEIDGREAYKVTQAWTETYPDETYYRQIRVTVDIPIGKDDYWSLDSYTISSEYPEYAELIDSMIKSFKITGVPYASAESEPEPVCGEGTVPKDGQCVPEEKGGGCLIATAAYGTELAPQVQFLREIRDNTVLSTASGTSFMTAFNSFYYSFSPTIADLERQNHLVKEIVKLTITPLLSSLSLLQYVEIDSETEMLGYGISIILLNVGMYFVVPTLAIVKVGKLFKNKIR